MTDERMTGRELATKAAIVAIGGVLWAIGITVPKCEPLGIVGAMMVLGTAAFSTKLMNQPLNPNHRE